MHIYLVGGAVRDALLHQPIGDRDYVVVGASPAEMHAQGFTTVGRDFPVFLHPTTKEEYALARTERKSGHGHRGFVTDANPDVTLEQDLQRRDFTINAIAQDPTTGALIDPYGGIHDLQARRLRHVSDAFIEDPLRILRAARFMAKLAPLGFELDSNTLELMRTMVATGSLETLAPERIWQELRRALLCAKPSAFLHTLRSIAALEIILPEVAGLYGVPQTAHHHPEIDSGAHQELVSDMVVQLAPTDAASAFAALTHDLGKALTPKNQWPRHLLHEQRGLEPIRQLCARLRVPKHFEQLAILACREHLLIHKIAELRPQTLLDLLERCDAFRIPERIAQLAIVCEADARGRQGYENTPYPQAAFLRHVLTLTQNIRARDIVDTSTLSGPEIGKQVQLARLRAITAAKELYNPNQPLS